MSVHVRRARPTDAQACAEIVFASLREHGITPEPEGLDRDVFGFGTREGRFRDFVAELEGETIGIACLEPWNDGGWISKVFVAAEARGHGAGRALLAATVEEAQSLGMTHLGLSTRRVFARAICLYESFGFVRTSASDDLSGPLSQRGMLDPRDVQTAQTAQTAQTQTVQARPGPGGDLSYGLDLVAIRRGADKRPVK